MNKVIQETLKIEQEKARTFSFHRSLLNVCHTFSVAGMRGRLTNSIVSPGRTAIPVEGEVEKRKARAPASVQHRSEEHTSELQSLMRISYAVFCLTKKKKKRNSEILKNKSQHILHNSILAKTN